MNHPLPFQARVIEERDALDVRLGRLRAFLLTPLAQGLPADERADLVEQEQVMSRYLVILNRRIARFDQGRQP
jgi:hypothetical protein